MDGEGVADFGTIDDHKEAVLALETSVVPATEAVAPAASSDHAHSHLTHGETDPSCEVCQEEERSSVSGGVAAGVASSGHGHSHAHNDHAHEGLEYDPDCAACNDEEEHGHVSCRSCHLFLSFCFFFFCSASWICRHQRVRVYNVLGNCVSRTSALSQRERGTRRRARRVS